MTPRDGELWICEDGVAASSEMIPDLSDSGALDVGGQPAPGIKDAVGSHFRRVRIPAAAHRNRGPLGAVMIGPAGTEICGIGLSCPRIHILPLRTAVEG